MELNSKMKNACTTLCGTQSMDAIFAQPTTMIIIILLAKAVRIESHIIGSIFRRDVMAV
jgi:hypothetical protein